MDGGYFSAFSEDWKPVADKTMSGEDINAAKSASTHLHILDAYTNLYAAAPGSLPKVKLISLVRLMLEKMHDENSGKAVFQ